MKIIFAQGNPGNEYAHTRHNVGFKVVDAIAETKAATWKKESKFNAETAQYLDGEEKVLLVKPHSFYNDTGIVARSIVDFFKLDPSQSVLVIHDELALPFGTVRVRHQGNDAGNNGIKDLNAHLGTSYTRIRIGIWNERRNLMDDADFVLSSFSTDEREALNTLIDTKIASLIDDFVAGSLEAASHKAA